LDEGPAGKTLAVVLHGWGNDAEAMDDVCSTIRKAYGKKVYICAPTLAHSKYFASIRATEIVLQTLDLIDKHVADDPSIERIVLVGHSFGATIVRRVFLVAAGYPGNFVPEKPLADIPRKAWADKVERIILLAAFNRGWRISDRLSWYYSIWFNIAGLLGHIIPRWRPTIFDIRLGAPFIVQTRLNWLAYRRQEQAARSAHADASWRRPILIQLIGTKDDLISPFDEVDIAVDGSRSGDAADRDYYLFEVPYTDHEALLKLHGDAKADKRRELLIAALREDRQGLDARALDPALLEDEIDPIDPCVTNTVFVIHGIRDDGYWTHRIAERVRRAGQSEQDTKYLFRGWTPTYGYFAMLPFLLPWVRREKVEWFMDQYVSAFAQYPNSDFHYVGHSNGTYLAARALRAYPAFHLKHILFAGSVVRYDFPWQAMFRARRVHRLQNMVACDDRVVAWLPKSLEWIPAFDVGGTGFDGFADAATTPDISELKYLTGGHHAGILEEHWDQIAAFVATGDAIEPRVSAAQPDLKRLYADQQDKWVAAIAETYTIIPIGAVIVFLLLPLFILSYQPWLSFALHVDALRLLILLLYTLLVRFVVLRF
jgi:pimeloyl-ACP methyl ester carboxylesterase